MLYHESDLDLEEHYTDTHGYTEINFAAFGMIGMRFCPRIRSLHRQRIYCADPARDHGVLEPVLQRGRRAVNFRLIAEQWDRIEELRDAVRANGPERVIPLCSYQVSQRLQAIAARPALTGVSSHSRPAGPGLGALAAARQRQRCRWRAAGDHRRWSGATPRHDRRGRPRSAADKWGQWRTRTFGRCSHLNSWKQLEKAAALHKYTVDQALRVAVEVWVEAHCPIPGCPHVFLARGGWDPHVASPTKHRNWHPEVQDGEKRKQLFKQKYPGGPLAPMPEGSDNGVFCLPAGLERAGVHRRVPGHLARGGFRTVMNEVRHWSMVLGLKKTGDVLARSDLCHLHDGRAEAESCASDPKLQRQDRDVVLVARSGSSQHVWVVRRSLSEIINGRLRRRSDASSARPLTRATA